MSGAWTWHAYKPPSVPPPTARARDAKNDARLSIAQYVWPNVELSFVTTLSIEVQGMTSIKPDGPSADPEVLRRALWCGECRRLGARSEAE